MLVRHGHMEAWVLNHEAASRKLLATLDPNVIRINPRATVWATRTLVKSNPKLESPRSVMPTRLPEPMPCLLSIPTHGKTDTPATVPIQDGRHKRAGVNLAACWDRDRIAQSDKRAVYQ